MNPTRHKQLTRTCALLFTLLLLFTSLPTAAMAAATQVTGRLTQMKQILKATIAADPNARGGLTAQDIDALTDGGAQTATQMVIWKYGNQSGAKFTLTASNFNGEDESSYKGDDASTEAELAAWNRINQIASYLVRQSKQASGTTQVLTPDTFIDSIGISAASCYGAHC